MAPFGYFRTPPAKEQATGLSFFRASFKDLSFALSQTGKINLILSVWMPIIAIGLFCSIGVIQINEK